MKEGLFPRNLRIVAGPAVVLLALFALPASAQHKKPPSKPPSHRKHAVELKPAAPPNVKFTGAQFWFRSWGTGPRIPLVGDANGDGHADLLSVYRQGDGVIDVALTSMHGKPVPNNQARTGFGKDALACAAGPFVRKGAADLLAVFADGSIRIATDMAAGSRTYNREVAAGAIPPDLLPKAPARAVVGDFDGDGTPDVLIADPDGRLLLLANRPGQDGAVRFVPLAVAPGIPGQRQITAGSFQAGKPAQLIWIDDKGRLVRAGVKVNGQGGSLTDVTTLRSVDPRTHLVAGRFRGGDTMDLLVGQELLIGGDPARAIPVLNLPAIEDSKDDAPWCAADFDGNGRDDVVRFRRTSGWGGEDAFVYFSVAKSDPYPGYYCSANDGLLDGWKTGKLAAPGGLDLQALGCKVGRAEILVDIERFDSFNVDELKKTIEEDVRYFASLPTPNPDGSTGITLIPIFRDPQSPKDHDRLMGAFDDYFPPKERRGVVHTMFAEKDGPLVAKMCGDNGHFNGGRTEFLHEFGHQIDLSHEGFHQAQFSAVYHSTMNYSYGYIDDPFTHTSLFYSDGRLAGLKFDEQHLSEIIPLPIDKVKFLSGEPYHFRLKPTADGQGTMVDWNWNGVFGETDVQADINYSHGVSIGPRYDVGRCQTAPVLVAYGTGDQTRLLLLYGQRPDRHSPSANAPAHLVWRVWQGHNRDTEGGNWSSEQTIEGANLIGDLSATYLNGAAWIAYPTDGGVVLQCLRLDAGGNAKLGNPITLRNSTHAVPTLTAFAGKLALLLWRGAEASVGLVMLETKSDDRLEGMEQSLRFRSAVPVAAVAGQADPGGSMLYVARIAAAGDNNAGKTCVHRYQLPSGGNPKDAGLEWIDGTYATHRMTVLWQAEKGLDGKGRVYHLSGGTTSKQKPWSEQYIAQQVAYKEIGGGWQLRRYQTNDYTSRSEPGACWFQGDFVYALRLHDGNPDRDDVISLGFYGSGATPETQGDFDDIHHLRDFGLSRSLPFVWE